MGGVDGLKPSTGNAVLANERWSGSPRHHDAHLGDRGQSICRNRCGARREENSCLRSDNRVVGDRCVDYKATQADGLSMRSGKVIALE